MAYVDIYGSEVTATTDDVEIDVVDESYLPILQSYLPNGLAWTRDPDAELTQLNRALAYEFSRVKRRSLDLLEEVDPRTTTEMIGDWERVYGLPDECSQPDTLAGRRVALQAKMLGNPNPSIDELVAMAAALGFTITISTPYRRANMFTCVSPCNGPLRTRQWMFLWVVTSMATDADAQLRCVLEDLAPDHTVLRTVQHEVWKSTIMTYADGVHVTVSAPATPPTDGPRPGASADYDPAWLGVGWSPELNSPVLVGAPGTFCMQLR